MPNLLDYYNRNIASVQKIVDTTFFMLQQDSSNIFNRIAPIVNYSDVMLLIMRFTRSKPTIASLVGDEQELPNSRSRIAITEELLSEARIGKQYIFTNNDFKAYRRLEAVLNQNAASDLVDDFESLFMGIAADIAPSIVEKMTVLLMEVLLTGQCNFSDPLTGVRMVLSYQGIVNSGVNQLIFTTQPPLATDRWNDPAANGLRDIDAHALAYYNNFGVFPKEMLIRWSAIRQLANQRSTKRALAANNGYGIETDPSIDAIYVKDQMVIDLISERMRGGKVTYLDGSYAEETETAVVDKYYLPDHSYLFVEDAIAQRAFVPTPEKDFEQGIYVNARELNDAPRRERIAGVGAGVPAVFDARKIAARRFL